MQLGLGCYTGYLLGDVAGAVALVIVVDMLVTISRQLAQRVAQGKSAG